MPYFADLTPHAYTRLIGVNVGWLDPAHPHPIGPALPTFLGALRAERGTVPLPPAAPDAVCRWTPHLYPGTIYEGELVRPTLGILNSRRRKPRWIAAERCERLGHPEPKNRGFRLRLSKNASMDNRRTFASVTTAPCGCGYLDRAADDPAVPIAFDGRAGEFQFRTANPAATGRRASSFSTAPFAAARPRRRAGTCCSP